MGKFATRALWWSMFCLSWLAGISAAQAARPGVTMTQPAPQFLFDFGSPNAYLSWKLLPDIAARQGARADEIAAADQAVRSARVMAKSSFSSTSGVFASDFSLSVVRFFWKVLRAASAQIG